MNTEEIQGSQLQEASPLWLREQGKDGIARASSLEELELRPLMRRCVYVLELPLRQQ